MQMISRLIHDLQESFNLVQWTKENSPQINARTTEMTVFYKGEKHETELWLRMVMSELLKMCV